MAPRIMLKLIVLVFALGSPNTQKSGGCERELAQCQTTVKQLNDQLRALENSCGSLKQELNDARLESQKWKEAYRQVKDDCAQQIAAARKVCEGVSNQVGDLNKKLAECSKALNNAQKESERWQRENAQNVALISDLRKQVTAPELERQLKTAKQEAEKYRSDYLQLSEKNAGLDTRYSNLNSEFSNLKKQMLSLIQSRDTLQQHLSAASQLLDGSRSENARLSATKSDLDRRVAELERRLKSVGVPVPEAPIPPDGPKPPKVDSGVPPDLTYNPQALLSWSKTFDERSAENPDRAGQRCEKDGKLHVTTQLVIGTLETSYDPNVRPGKTFPVEARFTPHPIMKVPQSADPITWHLELRYYSSGIKDVRYDTEMSAGKDQRRAIKLDGPAETWGWELTAPKDFQKDRSKIIVFAGPSQEPTLTEITREPVDLTEKETPGAFALALAFIKDNLSYILGVVSVLVAIWATLISIKKSKLEVRLKEMELEPRP